jgi:hypothetical protein
MAIDADHNPPADAGGRRTTVLLCERRRRRRAAQHGVVLGRKLELEDCVFPPSSPLLSALHERGSVPMYSVYSRVGLEWLARKSQRVVGSFAFFASLFPTVSYICQSVFFNWLSIFLECG